MSNFGNLGASENGEISGRTPRKSAVKHYSTNRTKGAFLNGNAHAKLDK